MDLAVGAFVPLPTLFVLLVLLVNVDDLGLSAIDISRFGGARMEIGRSRP
jgi:hypothetical protein